MRKAGMGAVCLFLSCQAGLWAARQVWRSGEALAIRGLAADKQQVKVFEPVVVDLDLAATFDNPFDADDVGIDAHVTEQGGRTWSAPGFYYRPYRRSEAADRRTEPAGDPRWQVRLSFPRPGRHIVKITARFRQYRVSTAKMSSPKGRRQADNKGPICSKKDAATDAIFFFL